MNQDRSGYSLLELMIVLVVIAGIGAIAGPPMARLYDRIAFSLAREDVEREISNLPIRARLEGRNLMLRDMPKKDRDPSKPEAETGQKEVVESASLALPSGWTLSVKAPILYRFDGLCLGGEIKINAASQETIYQLEPPFCRPKALIP
jgi:general secretion pathway protein G